MKLQSLSLLMIATASLSACNNMTAQNSPQNHYGTHIPSTSTKPILHPRSYVVRGKRYHVMKDPRGYREKGIASWYGNRFHHRRTSSGELFEKNELTAAHKTLPLMSHVKVKNLSNGKEIIVKINDRGPFVRNRLIDLSRGAAKALGMLQKGHGLVEVISLESEPTLFAPQQQFQRSSTITKRLNRRAKKRKSSTIKSVSNVTKLAVNTS